MRMEFAYDQSRFSTQGPAIPHPRYLYLTPAGMAPKRAQAPRLVGLLRQALTKCPQWSHHLQFSRAGSSWPSPR